jgi:hypothetical protein
VHTRSLSAAVQSGQGPEQLSVRCGGEAFHAVAASFVFLPRGCPHTDLASGKPARLLLIAVSSGIEDYFRHINAAVSHDERRRIRERYGDHAERQHRRGEGRRQRPSAIPRGPHSLSARYRHDRPGGAAHLTQPLTHWDFSRGLSPPSWDLGPPPTCVLSRWIGRSWCPMPEVRGRLLIAM